LAFGLLKVNPGLTPRGRKWGLGAAYPFDYLIIIELKPKRGPKVLNKGSRFLPGK
jgi:hypothetical protein